MLSQRENLLHFPAWLGWVDNNVSVACKLDGLGWHSGWVARRQVVCGSPGNHFSVTVMYEQEPAVPPSATPLSPVICLQTVPFWQRVGQILLRDHKVFGYSNIKSLCDQLICAYVQYNTPHLPTSGWDAKWVYLRSALRVYMNILLSWQQGSYGGFYIRKLRQ